MSAPRIPGWGPVTPGAQPGADEESLRGPGDTGPGQQTPSTAEAFEERCNAGGSTFSNPDDHRGSVAQQGPPPSTGVVFQLPECELYRKTCFWIIFMTVTFYVMLCCLLHHGFV